MKFQGIYNIPHIKYWSGLPDSAFEFGNLRMGENDANMFKGGIAYADMVTTVSYTYAQEIQTPEYGENLDGHLRYHSAKLTGIVNGIDVGQWDAANDALLEANYDISNVIEGKKANKLALQAQLGLTQDENKFVIGLVSRLTDQKGLDLINPIIPDILDGNTQLVVLGTGDKYYEESFRQYEAQHKEDMCAYIAYDEALAHKIYAACDAFLVPSRFEPCGLTQLTAMHYGTLPIVRETGGLKDTVAPCGADPDSGNGFTFDRYEKELLLDAINRAKDLYFNDRDNWNIVIKRDMEKDVTWENSAGMYLDLYNRLG